MEILECLADALLEVGRGHDLEIFLQPEPLLHLAAPGRMRHDVKRIHAPLDAAADHDLELPARPELRQRTAHGFVARRVATDGLERGCDVLLRIRHAEMPDELLGAQRAVIGGIAFRHDEREHAFRAQRAHGEPEAGGAVDTAGHRDHQSAPPQHLRQRFAYARTDAVGLGFEIDLEHARGQDLRSLTHPVDSRLSSAARCTFPDGVRGRQATNSMNFGTL
jgi:hypothetical protein